MLALDGEPGAEVYAGASSEAQAWKVFQPARQMALVNPHLPAKFKVGIQAQSLTRADGSVFKPIIGKPGDGDSPHCAITDEYHEHATSEQIDTMETGMGAREQPLSIVISTAGTNTASPCRDDWKNCELILNGTPGFHDDTTFAIIYTIDDDDQWDTEAALIKANPNWGISIEPSNMLADLKAAQQRANKQSAFQTKHLNKWVSIKQAYFNITEWQKLARPEIKREDFREYPCFLSGDLASKHDLVALMQLFCLPDKRYALFGKYYLPEATLELPENQHYRNWHIAGWIEKAGIDVTDLDHFKEDVLELCAGYQVEEMPSDPNRAWGVYPALVKEGVPIVEYRNTVLMMSEPMKELDSLIRSGRIIHCGDPVLEWAIGNTTGKMDQKENVFPNKESPANKIDPVVGTIMALGRAMLKDDSPAGPLVCF
jgi:phage terminase large subunit-like protein